MAEAMLGIAARPTSPCSAVRLSIVLSFLIFIAFKFALILSRGQRCTSRSPICYRVSCNVSERQNTDVLAGPQAKQESHAWLTMDGVVCPNLSTRRRIPGQTKKIFYCSPAENLVRNT
jgi:hypothetical protein